MSGFRIPGWRECQTCGGEGKWNDPGEGGVDCPDCEGEGRLPPWFEYEELRMPLKDADHADAD